MSIQRFELGPLLQPLQEGVCLLVPNLRLQDAILEAYGSQYDARVHRTPPVYPVDIWIQQLFDSLASTGRTPFCDTRLLDPAEELVYWTQIIEQSDGDYPLLNSSETARLVAQSYRDMRQWRLSARIMGSELAAFEQPDWAAFQFWSRKFEGLCRNQSVCNLADAIGLLCDWLQGEDATLPKSYASLRLMLVQFDDPPPLYRKLFELLGEHLALESHEVASTETAVAVSGQVYPDLETEAQACINWAMEKQRQNPDFHIGILLPSRGENVGALERAHHNLSWQQSEQPTSNDWCNRSKSETSLEQTGLGHFLLTCLDCLFNETELEVLCRLLQSPFLLAQEELPARIRLEWTLRDRQMARLQLQDWVALISEDSEISPSPALSARLLECRELIRHAPARQPCAQWSELFQTLLTRLIDPDSIADFRTHMLWDRLLLALQEFAEHYRIFGSMTAPSALARLRRLFANSTLTPGYSTLRQVSLYTIDEALGLRFDAVWLLGFDDISWPAAAQPSPFLPGPLQREIDLPGARPALQLADAQRQTRELLCRVSHAAVCSLHQYDGEQELRPSNLLPVQEWLDAKPVQQDEPIATAAPEDWRWIDDASPGAVAKTEGVRGGQAIFSDQANCPFKAFARHRLSMTLPKPPGLGLSPALRGVGIHMALEQFYGQVADLAALQALSADELKQRFEQASDLALKYMSARQPRLLTPRYRQLEKERIELLLALFVELDRSRTDFAVLALEKSLEWELGTVAIRIKLDRVDRLPNGELAIIDYKTGRGAPRKADWLNERPMDAQIPLYATAAPRLEAGELATLSLAMVNRDKPRFLGATASTDFHQSLKPSTADKQLKMPWPQLLTLWEQHIGMLGAAFVAGDASVDPLPLACDRCSFTRLCRINELEHEVDLDGLDLEENHS